MRTVPLIMMFLAAAYAGYYTGNMPEENEDGYLTQEYPFVIEDTGCEVVFYMSIRGQEAQNIDVVQDYVETARNPQDIITYRNKHNVVAIEFEDQTMFIITEKCEKPFISFRKIDSQSEFFQ